MIWWVKFPNFVTILLNSFKKHDIWIWIFWNSDISSEGLEVGSGFLDSHVHSIRCVVQSLCEKCSYSELFWSAFFWIWTEYGEISSISPYSVRMWQNVDQNNSEYGHVSRSECYHYQTKSKWEIRELTKHFARLFKGKNTTCS